MAAVVSEASGFDALMRAGARCFHTREWSRALAMFDGALATSPDDTRALNYRARTLEALGRLPEALEALNRAVTIDPTCAADWRNRGLALRKLGHLEEAIASFDRALEIVPNFVDVLVKKASALEALERREEALAVSERALALSPDNASAINTRGIILERLQRYTEAQANFERLAQLDRESVDALNNVGMIAARRGDFQEALAYYDRSLARKADQPAAHYNRSIVRLALGDWLGGFVEYEYRWQVAPLERMRFDHLGRRWNGEDVAGKTVLIHHEQGYGDTLQFVRYVPKVRKLGARVILAVPAGLRRLLGVMRDCAAIVSEGDPVPAHDYYCPMISLAAVFRTTPETVPPEVPYLTPDPKLVAHWKERLGDKTRPRIGILWSGRQTPPINYPRDIPLAKWRPLFDLEADFFGLQPSMFDADREALSRMPGLRHAGEALTDFAETAALICNLDLVIAVDSAVAHLAGALGRPVWLLNRYASCWRWLQQGTTTPWYSTMRLFRQPRLGDWDSVIQTVCKEAAHFIASVRATTSVGILERLSDAEERASAEERPSGPRGRARTSRGEVIRFVCATRSTSEQFFAAAPLGRSLALYRTFPRGHRIELRLFKENREGLSSVYNRAIDEAQEKPAILVFIHDDVYLSDFYWAKHLVEGLDKFDVIGLAGDCRRIPRQASWMYLNDQFVREAAENLSGVLGHGKGFPELIELSDYGEPGQEVKLLDGVMLAVRSRTLTQHRLRFDPRFHFHFYDMDFCRQAELRGLRMGTWALSLIHASPGALGVADWRRAYREYLEKYGE